MGVHEDGDQLYMQIIMKLLRDFQRRDHQPTLQEFIHSLQNVEFARSQEGPLRQRLALLESIVIESKENEAIQQYSVDISSLFKPGSFVIVDYSNPLVVQTEANSVFNVLLQKFLEVPLDNCGRLVVLDEAHKYLAKEHGEFGATILQCIRQMRHHGLRVVIATQNPSSMEKEMIELCSIITIHHFSAPSWFNLLSDKIPLPKETFQIIQDFALIPGDALVYSPKSIIHASDNKMEKFYKIHIRQRLTKDAGRSINHI